ncbi:sel1 repeat family protein [Helicobacter didelphidarum]|uniref:Sel1 repeat family protein n=1 Tax=Helicobacter didelphidarum TaxID=2040648 RepID=A0A3D8ILE1_9HELI|nr:sel1 repeat family protein [Helicobacter didelphidarum]RDU66018.1 sel1 repeat family protein [Helicobacter didelphidarum]
MQYSIHYTSRYNSIIMWYFCCQILILLLIGCGATPNKQSNVVPNINLKSETQWKEIPKQILDDIAQSQKMNLFSKCYYYENVNICKHILDNFELECKSGIGLSCGLRGLAFVDGRGVAKNLQQALESFQQGCYFDDSLSCMYMRKYYIQYNQPEKAQAILDSVQNSCAEGKALECFLLSIVYENDTQFSSQADKIVQYRKNACEKKFALACGYLDDKKLDKESYQQYQKRACDFGMMAACDAYRESMELNIRTKHTRLYRIW